MLTVLQNFKRLSCLRSDANLTAFVDFKNEAKFTYKRTVNFELV